VLGACLGLLAQAPAPQPAPARTDPQQIKRRLTEVQARLGAVDAQLEALKKRRKGVLVELQATLLDADRVRAQAEAARLKRDQAKEEVAAIGARKEAIMRDIAALRAELRKQVRWMQARGPLGDLSFLSGLSSFEAFVVEGRYQVYLRNRERRRLDTIQTLQGDLARREQELTAAMQLLAADEQLSTQAQASLQVREEHLQQFLDGLKQDEGRQKEVQAELAEEALQLDRMLTQLLGRPRNDAYEAPSAFANLHGSCPSPPGRPGPGLRRARAAPVPHQDHAERPAHRRRAGRPGAGRGRRQGGLRRPVPELRADGDPRPRRRLLQHLTPTWRP